MIGKQFNIILNSLNKIIGAINQQNVLYKKQEVLEVRQSYNHEETDCRILLQAYAYDVSQKDLESYQ